MDWLKKNPEKVTLMLVAVIALGFGVKHLLSVQGYAKTFDLPTTGKKGKSIPETPEALVQQSATLVELPLFWKDKKIEIPGSSVAKEVPVLRSVYIVEKDGKLFDLANPNTAPLRPPVPNTWILGHQLEILNPNVLQMDADSDGFTNIEEWEAKTDPLKRESHPPYTDKLFFVSRPQLDMALRFAVNSAPDFQIVLRTRQRTITNFYREGKSFPESQKFTLMKYIEKKDAAGVDNSELEVRDNENQKTVSLPLRKDVPWPVYAVDFEFPLGRSAEEQKLRIVEGKTFRLSLDPETEYTLVAAAPDSATINKAGSTETIVIRKRAESSSPAPGAATPEPGTATPAPGAATPAPGTAAPAPGTPAPAASTPAPGATTPPPGAPAAAPR